MIGALSNSGGMILAQHLHGTITRHGLVAVAILGAGAAILLVAWKLRRLRRLGVVIGVLVLGIGVFELVETEAMSHNHICHNHHSQDMCSPRGAGENHYRTHDHWLGRSTLGEDD